MLVKRVLIVLLLLCSPAAEAELFHLRSGWVPALISGTDAQVLDGVEVVDANTIRFTMPRTSLPRRVVVRDGNQQQGVINDDTVLMTAPGSRQHSTRRR